jgi:hypothetical protein
MPALPWTTFADTDPDREYVAMASRLPLARHRHIPAFLRATTAIGKQLSKTDGVLGYALDAHPLRKTFWTLSVWESEDALGRFAHADPHRDRVEGIRPRMRPTTFVTWTVHGSDLPIRWADARARVAEAAGS